MSSYIEPSENAKQVINKRYSRKNEQGEPLETWSEIVHRVVSAVAVAEKDPIDRGTFFNNIRDLMESRKFIPNTPCLVNAGTGKGALAGCYTLPVGDSLREIMTSAMNAALIHQTGGGTGFTFEKLRPKGALVRTHNGIASGPISFMEVFDKVTDVVKQGGVRRGANMGILPVWHPDILEFIHAKNNQDKLINFNVSVAITDEFMTAVKNKDWYQTRWNGQDWTKPVYDPVQDPTVWPPAYGKWAYSHTPEYQQGKLYAPDVWDRIVTSAHRWGEPGVIFIDEVNRHNLLKKSMGLLTESNPCSEQFLHDYNSCNLGSIDVSKFFNKAWDDMFTGKIRENNRPEANFDWLGFKEAVYWSVRFLDNVIDVCPWPLPEIEDVVKRTRPIGLGIMGFADLLLKFHIKYGSQESLMFLETLMHKFQRFSWEASLLIGREKGVFSEFEANRHAYESFLEGELDITYFNEGLAATPRNYEVTTIAPCGTISLVAECSSGIEPNFAWTYTRRDTVGERRYIHPLAAEELGIGLQDPHTDFILSMKKLPDYFVTAHDLSSLDHARVLATAQKYVDNGVSKTCNGSISDTVDDVRKLYEYAYENGIKSVSYYRDGSREGQVLTTTKSKACKECGTSFSVDIMDKCETCPACGFGTCAV